MQGYARASQEYEERITDPYGWNECPYTSADIDCPLCGDLLVKNDSYIFCLSCGYEKED